MPALDKRESLSKEANLDKTERLFVQHYFKYRALIEAGYNRKDDFLFSLRTGMLVDVEKLMPSDRMSPDQNRSLMMEYDRLVHVRLPSYRRESGASFIDSNNEHSKF